jgi:ribosomal protein S27E
MRISRGAGRGIVSPWEVERHAMGIARSVNYPVRCEKCTHRAPKAVAWLIDQNKMPCEECGATIDLQTGDNVVVIM